MVEKQTKTVITEEKIDAEDSAKETTKTQEIKANQAKHINKFLKQENFKTKAGNEFTVTFPGMEEAQDLFDESNAPEFKSQYLSNFRKHVLFLDKILEDNLEIKDFEKDLRKAKKTIEIEEEDGKKVKYNLQFPKIGELEQMIEQEEVSGRAKPSYEFMLQHVLTKPLSLKYFDTHAGYMQILAQTSQFLMETYTQSEYKEVIEYIDDFLDRMFL